MLRLNFVNLFMALSLNLFSQVVEIPCENLKNDSNIVVLAYGITNKYRIDKSWLQEYIPNDSITKWSMRYINETMVLGDENQNLLEKLIEREIEHIQTKIDSISLQIGNNYKLFYYSTPDSYWNKLKGQDGIVFIRDCEVKGVIIIRESL